MQSFLKPFETIGDKTRWQEFVSTFHYPESPYRRTDAGVITKISPINSLSNFFTHGALLRAQGLRYKPPVCTQNLVVQCTIMLNSELFAQSEIQRESKARKS